jgi:hypothetical protein
MGCATHQTCWKTREIRILRIEHAKHFAAAHWRPRRIHRPITMNYVCPPEAARSFRYSKTLISAAISEPQLVSRVIECGRGGTSWRGDDIAGTVGLRRFKGLVREDKTHLQVVLIRAMNHRAKVASLYIVIALQHGHNINLVPCRFGSKPSPQFWPYKF